ncbi:MAG: cysteine hydrolase family protein [Planctomycetota bacterium]|jgi:nicotinamidase-related amidase
MAKKDWRRFALVLIDVQRDFWSGATASHFPAFPDNVAALLQLCRREGIEVVHCYARYEPDGSDWMPVYKLRGDIPCIRGTKGAEPLPFAEAEPGERIFWKKTYDGFLFPGLSAYLRERNKSFLLFAGLRTSICVSLTAASASQRGFLCALVEDACADNPPAHAFTLENFEGLTFERVLHDRIPERHAGWMKNLKRLETVNPNRI